MEFEKKLAQLQDLVQKLEAGTLPIEEALLKYEEGVRTIRECEAYLSASEKKVENLSKIESQDSTRTTPH